MLTTQSEWFAEISVFLSIAFHYQFVPRMYIVELNLDHSFPMVHLWSDEINKNYTKHRYHFIFRLSIADIPDYEYSSSMSTPRMWWYMEYWVESNAEWREVWYRLTKHHDCSTMNYSDFVHLGLFQHSWLECEICWKEVFDRKKNDLEILTNRIEFEIERKKKSTQQIGSHSLSLSSLVMYWFGYIL